VFVAKYLKHNFDWIQFYLSKMELKFKKKEEELTHIKLVFLL